MIWRHLRNSIPYASTVALLCGLAIPSEFIVGYPVRLAYGLVMAVLIARVFIYLAPKRRFPK